MLSCAGPSSQASYRVVVAGEGGQNGGVPVPLPKPLPSVTLTDSTQTDTLSIPQHAHLKRPRARLQRWTTPTRVAHYFGVDRVTVVRWLHRKRLGAFMATHRHYSDERERKTSRGRWRIFESDLEKLLTAMRVKKSRAGLGPGFWVGGGK